MLLIEYVFSNRVQPFQLGMPSKKKTDVDGDGVQSKSQILSHVKLGHEGGGTYYITAGPKSNIAHLKF